MIQLFLDGKIAIPHDNSNIKLTTENPYFTKSASYTYDVELPLDIAENREIFGWIGRMDITKEARLFDAILVVDNVTVLTGTAHITSVSEKAVKVQLLGEAASYNYGNKMDKAYIDELDLGDWYMTTWPDGSYWKAVRPGQGGSSGWSYYPKDTKFKGNNVNVFSRANYKNNGYDHSGQTLLDNLFSGDYPWVAMPIFNSSADFLCNGYAYRFTSSANNAVEFFLRGYEGEKTGKRPSDDPPVTAYAIQPYVWIMAEKIAEATGFSLSKEDNALYSDEFFRRIFIANANNYIECNKCLPHWSVNEWWTQIEQTFGLVMTVDYSARKIFLRKRSQHYSTAVNTVELKNIVEEFNVDIDDETESDISSNNVGFSDFENGPEDLLSEFIMNNARFIDEYESINQLLAWANTQTSAILETSYKDVLFRCKDGRQYIYSASAGFIEVNMFRPRIVNGEKDDIDIELKIVPARFIEYECSIYPYIVQAPDGTGTQTKDVPLGTFPVKILSTPNISEMDWYKENYDDRINIDAIINEEEDESSKETSAEDVIYIAIADLDYRDTISATVSLSTGGSFKDTFKYPRAFLRERTVAQLNGAPAVRDPKFSLSLIPIEGQTNLASKTLSGDIGIDATVRHCIRFIADRIPEPGSIFLIHNRKYVCEKIEADIASTGLKKLLTGYFYEMKS